MLALLKHQRIRTCTGPQAANSCMEHWVQSQVAQRSTTRKMKTAPSDGDRYSLPQSIDGYQLRCFEERQENKCQAHSLKFTGRTSPHTMRARAHNSSSTPFHAPGSHLTTELPTIIPNVKNPRDQSQNPRTNFLPRTFHPLSSSLHVNNGLVRGCCNVGIIICMSCPQVSSSFWPVAPLRNRTNQYVSLKAW